MIARRRGFVMNDPHVYIHRIGRSYHEYMTPENEASLESFARVTNDGPMEERIPAERLRATLEGVDALLSLNGVGAEDITEDVLRDIGTVKVAVISHYFHGSHDRASAAWRKAGLKVIDASDGNNRAVAEWTLGAAIAGLYRFAEFDRAMKGGARWPDQSQADQLEGKTVGIVGLGRVGRIVARYLGIFDVKLIGYDAYVDPEKIRSMGVEPVDLLELMARADLITLHLPVTEDTRGLIGRRELASIRDGALLINSARAAVLDGKAFREELGKKRFRAILDVYDPEPPPDDDVLRKLDNVVMTPHIAGNTRQMRADCGRIAIQALKDYFG
jgi:phosphoglycerate dehydrogenase-like enzyme